MATPTIVFDLDGTLVDTAPDLIETLNVILAADGLPHVPYDDARRLIGFGARRMIEGGLARAGRNTADVERMYDAFIDHYSTHVADRSRPFPGVLEALDTLAGRGFTLAVCTNKLEWLSVQLLTALGLAERFAAICGQDTFGVQKPDPKILLGTLRKAGGDRGRAVMVGDSRPDIAVARAAGIPVVAVDFGYAEVAIDQLDPDRIISNYNQLSESVDTLLQLRATSPGGGPARPEYR
jgi:phosphoglycolate phosphatase